MSLFKVDESYSDMLARLFYWKYPDKETIEVTFQVTEACSLACTYCYQHNKTPKVMSLEVAKKYIDTIFKEYQDSHYAIILDFIGGEPLLQPDLIMDTLDYWYYKCIMENIEWGVLTRVSICSNGTEYFKPAVQKLMKRLGNRLSFTVSIDGNEALHDSARIFPDGRGSYKYAIAAANDFETTHNTTLGSKMTIAPNNLMFLFPALKHYMQKGAKIIHANCVFEEGWTYEHATILYNELKKVADYKLEHYPDVYISLFEEDMFEPMPENDNQNWCGGTGKMLACDPDGNLYPCLRYMPSSLGDKQKPLTSGDVFSGLDRSVAEELGTITRRSQSTDECFYCPIAKGCSWCSAYNYEVHGTVNKRATFICPMHKARALANVYYWNKYYRQNNMANRKKNHCPEEWALEIVDRDELIMLQTLTLED
jgi:radical SAM peptide maturase (CXXX-repeat target family)